MYHYFPKKDATEHLKHTATLMGKLRGISGDYVHFKHAVGSRGDEPRSKRKATVPPT